MHRILIWPDILPAGFPANPIAGFSANPKAEYPVRPDTGMVRPDIRPDFLLKI
jgi:hypothetical protein